jgi:hypothetical protein
MPQIASALGRNCFAAFFRVGSRFGLGHGAVPLLLPLQEAFAADRCDVCGTALAMAVRIGLVPARELDFERPLACEPLIVRKALEDGLERVGQAGCDQATVCRRRDSVGLAASHGA